MINFYNVTKKYQKDKTVLSDLTFEIKKGEMVFITGRSGAGKTTLLKHIAIIEKPTFGTIKINNINVTTMKNSDIPYMRRNFGLIFQDHKLLFDQTVFENVALPLLISDYPKKNINSRVRAALNKVGLSGKETNLPITLSGGEQQRLCIARAIINRPSILIADEPTANLDIDYSKEIMKMFQEFNQVGVTIIISTHDQSLIKKENLREIKIDKGIIK